MSTSTTPCQSFRAPVLPVAHTIWLFKGKEWIDGREVLRPQPKGWKFTRRPFPVSHPFTIYLN